VDLTQPTPHQPATATSNGLAFWTVAEVAAFARVSKMTIYRLVHAGDLESVRVGRSFRILSGSVTTYFSPGAATPQEPRP
jgi:excisionase family DNA binding protein